MVNIYNYLQGFIHPKWCRISSINSISFQISLDIQTLGEDRCFNPQPNISFLKHLLIRYLVDLGCLGMEIFGTLPETNIAPANGWLEDELPLGMASW